MTRLQSHATTFSDITSSFAIVDGLTLLSLHNKATQNTSAHYKHLTACLVLQATTSL